MTLKLRGFIAVRRDLMGHEFLDCNTLAETEMEARQKAEDDDFFTPCTAKSYPFVRIARVVIEEFTS